jgi:hypothetical protein
MPVETRAAVRFRERNDETFEIIGRLVYNSQRKSCTHCDAEFIELMELYDLVIESKPYRQLAEKFVAAELYVIAKCAEYLGAWSVYENIRCGSGHMFTLLDLARYDVFWRQICAELDITYVHSK